MAKKSCFLLSFKISLIFLISSCSSFQKKASLDELPPAAKISEWKSYDLKQISDQLKNSSSLNTNERWWLQARKINLLLATNKLINEPTSNHPEVCQEILKLTNPLPIENSRPFPILNLYKLKYLAHCETDNSTASDMSISIMSDFEKIWYQSLIYETQLKLANKTKNQTLQIQSLINMSNLEKNFSKKEDLLEQAVHIAKELNDPALIEQANSALYINSPRLDPNLKNTDPLRVARDHRTHREFSKALQIYRQIRRNTKNNIEKRFAALKQEIMTLKSQQMKPEHIQAVQTLYQFLKSNLKTLGTNKSTLDGFLICIRAFWTDGNTEYAQKILANTLDIFSKNKTPDYSLDEPHWVMARIYEELENYDKSHEHFLLALQNSKPKNQFYSRIVSNLAWLEYKANNFTQSTEHFSLLANSSTELSDRAKGLFWQAQSEKKLNQNNYKKTLEELITLDSLGYYGMLAMRELGKNFSPLKSQQQHEDPLSGFDGLSQIVDLSLALKIEWLMSLDEKPFAEKALQQIKQPTDFQKQLILYAQQARVGVYLPLFTSLPSLDPNFRQDILNKQSHLLFPLNYSDIAISWSKKNDIPVELIFSIIRQESAFDPNARSPAEAFGLMQMLPSLAKSLAPQLGVPYKDAPDLFQPEVNIPIGSFELRRLLSKYSGRYILAISNYNANEKAIQSWLRNRHRENPIEFIEEIPYEETRTYVKLVLRNFVFYRRLISNSEFPFPEELLKF